MNNIPRVCVLFILSVMLGGCFSSPAPESRSFLLDPGVPPSMRAMRTSATVSVTFVDIRIPFSSDGFVYQLSGDRWEVDPYNQFLVSPAEMMTGIVRNWLQDSQLFKNVAIPSEGGGQTFIVDLDVTKLYADFQNPSSPTAVIAMEVQVLRRTREGSTIVMRKSFSESVPFSERRPQKLVEAWNTGLRLNLEELLAAFVTVAE